MVCFSCGFLVSVMWMASARFSPRLSFCLSFRHPFRFSTRSPFRLLPRFSFRPSGCFSLRSSVRFLVSFISFGRVGWAVRGTRCFCRLFVAGVGLFSFVSLCRGGGVGACR